MKCMRDRGNTKRRKEKDESWLGGFQQRPARVVEANGERGREIRREEVGRVLKAKEPAQFSK